MNVDGISTGVVLDHIKAGRSMDIYNYLHLDELDCSVAIIKNVKSNRLGRKDIIKIDAEIDLNFEVIGYIDPNITVNIVKNGELIEKRHLKLPKEVKNVIKCKNPRCITTVEPEVDQIFRLASEETGVYRCIYCESEAKK